jgi:hypothetical protein
LRCVPSKLRGRDDRDRREVQTSYLAEEFHLRYRLENYNEYMYIYSTVQYTIYSTVQYTVVSLDQSIITVLF